VKNAAVGLLVAAALCAAATVSAQEKLRVGIVDISKIMAESKIGKEYRGELDKMTKDRRDKLGKEEAAIKALHEKLEKDKLVLNDKQKEQKQKEIEDKVVALRKQVQEAQQEVGKREAELSQKATVSLREVVAVIAKQEKLPIVIDKNPPIVWAEEEVDITDKVMKAYDAKGVK
jgi:outer membrane protein